MDPTQWGAPFPLVVAALHVIVMLRASGTYLVGRAVVAGTAHTRFAHLVQSAGYRRAAERIDRWGPPAVAVCFLTIGVQTLVNLAAGAARMRLRHYLPAIAIGGLAWALIYATIGFAGFAAIGTLWERSPVLAVLVVGGGATALVVYLVRQVLRARARRAAASLT
nr:hypothetical protein [Propionibacterium sp.]